jgi:hypothetical protein
MDFNIDEPYNSEVFKFKNRFFTTKVRDLIDRDLIRNDYPHEFMNKMNDEEIDVFVLEVQNQIKEIGVKVGFNIYQFNIAVKERINEREELYQSLKLIEIEARSYKKIILEV